MNFKDFFLVAEATVFMVKFMFGFVSYVQTPPSPQQQQGFLCTTPWAAQYLRSLKLHFFPLQIFNGSRWTL